MALQETPKRGVAVREVYRAWVDQNVNPLRLPTGAGWEKSAVGTIEFYRDANTVYAFPTLADLRAAMLPWFETVSTFTPSYELGERCPTLVLRPKKGASGTHPA
jgi:hypothetical protein